MLLSSPGAVVSSLCTASCSASSASRMAAIPSSCRHSEDVDADRHRRTCDCTTLEELEFGLVFDGAMKAIVC
jgi:hypothetical protein